MAGFGGGVSTVAERYAGALFELARAGDGIEIVERGLDRFRGLLDESSGLRRLVLSPVFSSGEQRDGLDAICRHAGIKGLVRDFLLVLARNRRLFASEQIIKAYKNLAARERGEVEAEIVSAAPLSEAQRQELAGALRQKLGKAPKLAIRLDPSLLGGLVVKVGSQMIDTSLKTKLKNLEIQMKEAG